MDGKEMKSVCRDSISSLPDETLAQILCYLPTKRAASTSILSKRWRNMFAMMIRLFASQHHLEFDDSDLLYPDKQRSQESFRDLVVSTLSLQQQNGNRISFKKFTVKCQDDFEHITAGTSRWISDVLERGVSDLDLRITMPLISYTEQIEESLLPSIVFTSKTLVKLTLGTGLCFGSPPVSNPCLPVLKSLFLYSVWFPFEPVSDFVLWNCPVLEELYIHHEYISHESWQGPSFISHPTVKKITLHLDYHFPQVRSLSFNTPNLVYLNYSDHVLRCDYLCTDFLDSLLEARLDLSLPRSNSYEIDNSTKIISWICNVQILELSSNTVELMCECLDSWRDNGGFPLFKNLVYLSFESRTERGWKILWSLIANSLKLETLILKGFGCVTSNDQVSIDGNVAKVLEIYGYRGTSSELSQVKRFLWEIEFLQVLKVELDATVDDDDKKLQLTKDLLALPKRSSKCQIHFL